MRSTELDDPSSSPGHSHSPCHNPDPNPNPNPNPDPDPDHSKVRSTELDDFDESLFLWFESLGNEKNNQRWEAELPATVRL